MNKRKLLDRLHNRLVVVLPRYGEEGNDELNAFESILEDVVEYGEVTGDSSKERESIYGLSVIAHGNPIDGIAIVGPFKTPIEAAEYGDKFLDADWWVTPLIAPEKTQ